MPRDQLARQALGSSLSAHIAKSKVLLVGAGGIGCELLKNLVLSGFQEVHLVDLDTIDLSNLNRQFLFRHEHIKKSKALVAKESALRFNPTAKVEAYHANIMDSKFDGTWFTGFDIVFNALDNLQARRHVNKLCLAADVPLIESGTTGYNGQVQVIKRGTSECYECNPKETPKTFPVCTIRSTPTQPIHCIVWAKSYLLNELFGASEDEPTDFDHTEDSDNAKEIESLRVEAQALKKIKSKIGTEEFGKLVFDKVFQIDIKRLLTMEDMWKSRKPPAPIEYDTVRSLSAEQQQLTLTTDQRPWSLEENLAVFKNSIERLSARAKSKLTGSGIASIAFDKDDPDTLDFVAAASNLRSIVFAIATKSRFDIKQMAGNIIPAIATTNAVTAGFCVLQAFKVLKDQYDQAKMIFLTKSTDRFISADKLQPPNKSCAVCRNAQSLLHVDLERATLQDLVEGFLKMELGYSEEISIIDQTDTMIYDQDLAELLPKKMKDLGIKGNSFLKIRDEDDEPRIDLHLSLVVKSLPADSKPVVAPNKIEVPRASISQGSGVNGHVSPIPQPPELLKRRKRDEDDLEQENDRMPKKIKFSAVKGSADKEQSITLVDDSVGGAIVIED
ncbi:MAG: E1 ubiquitin-activating protein uba2 [Vezdaea aestivalis]|nr:MAG: E1 ubiquitin-activating protein uba2 [Vezdaea aestivalis]